MIRPDTIIRSNRKTLSISVDVYNRLIVRAPKHCSEERIFAFLQAKESWILRKKQDRAKSGVVFPGEDLNGYKLLLLGKERVIRVCERKFVGFDENTDEILLPSNQPKQRLIKWLKENARRIFTRITEEKAKQPS